MLSQLNSPPLYLICGLIILFVAIVCVIFLVRAYRAGKKAGMDPAVLKRAIVTHASGVIVLPESRPIPTCSAAASATCVS